MTKSSNGAKFVFIGFVLLLQIANVTDGRTALELYYTELNTFSAYCSRRENSRHALK